ncbi:MAG: phosphoglucosamine mutase, partial [Nitrospirota bacterium]
LIMIDERGEIVDGDKVLAMFAIEFKRSGRLSQDTLVATVMSNFGLDIAMKDAGIKVVRTPVGDRYVMEEMIKNNYNLGGEQSGHIIFLDFNTTGDGLVTALQVLTLVQKTGKRLSELASCMKTFPQKLVNIRVREKKDLDTLPDFVRVIKESEKRLEGRGRIVVRYSGTESLLRIMAEGEKEEEIIQIIDNISEAVNKYI